MYTLHETYCMHFEFDDTKKLFILHFKPDSERATEQDIKSMIFQATTLIKELQPDFVIGNDKDRRFAYTVDIQHWVAIRFVEASIEAGVKKFVIILPDDLVYSLSTTQTVEEAPIIPFELRYMDSIKEAMAWFNEKEITQ